MSGSRYIRYSTMSLSRKLRFVLSFWADGRGKGGTLHIMRQENGGLENA
jgi:hypothetical protein